MKSMEIYLKKRKIILSAQRVSFWRRGIGLMFRTKQTENLLFEFKRYGNRPITSVFVFFPFLSLWLDSANNVVDFKIIRPFTPEIYAKNNFMKLVEIPFNDRNKKIIGFLVGEEKFK